MLQAKAAEIASSLQMEKFTASNGWLEAFRRRNKINFRVLCGESANVEVEEEEADQQLLNPPQSIVMQYNMCIA
jgi:hypothetical protein